MAPAEGIQDGSNLHGSLLCWDIGDVSHPDLLASIGRGHAEQTVSDHRLSLARFGRKDPATTTAAAQAVLHHEPHDPAPADRHALALSSALNA